MIRMINGSTLINGTLYSASSGPFEAGEATEKRLVALGAAAYTTEKPLTPAESGAAATGSARTGNDTPGETKPTEGRETDEGRLDPEQLRELTNKQLKKLAEDMGLDTSKMKVKEDFVSAIAAVPVEPGGEDESADEEDAESEDGEQPPELGAEEPVV